MCWFGVLEIILFIDLVFVNFILSFCLKLVIDIIFWFVNLGDFLFYGLVIFFR